MNPKFRFGNKNFSQKLKLARQFHRNPRQITENKFKKLLILCGLKTLFRQLLAIFVFLLLAFSVYFPNWFFVKQINIQGAGDIEINIQNAILNYFSLHKLIPQQNLILLKKSALTEYLEKNLSGILKVEKIEKKFFHTLNLTIQKRQNIFLLTSNLGTFSVSNDGKITSEIYDTIAPTSSLKSLIQVQTNLTEKPALNFEIFNSEWVKKFIFSNSVFSEIFKQKGFVIEIGDLKIQELGIIFENGLKIYINTNQDLHKTLEQLKLLLSEILPGDLKKLSYIDMRFLGKGYVCFKNLPCETNSPILYKQPQINEQATSTQNILVK
jgi:cell division septal protein FtsQ